MNPSPLVSVIVSCYNHEQYIQACIESIVAQTYPNIEIIAIDDGSRDRSPEILAELAQRHGFEFTPQENLGLSRTLNQAVERARGKYICTMGSDDIMLPDKTARQVAFMEQNPDVAVCGGNALVIDSQGTIVNRRQKFPPYREITFEHLFEGTGAGIIAPTAMIRRDIFLEVGGYDPDIRLEDMYLWLKITHLRHRMVGLNDVLLYYRKHPTNTYKNIELMSDSLIRIYQQYRDHPSFEKVMNRYLNSAFLNAAKAGKKQLAWSMLRRIPLRYWSSKIPRGLIRLMSPTHSKA